ncbi:epoxide hydrolase family protein [Sphingomonas sp. BK235]|uniref:epoxide hydrolase family protein n=1 Tax=Sphingomonas sp. BK235 TaxID=2512131 RepID=UPI00104C8B0E|nr:epoxide hydrolase family protein [Sphingomonas sp. BK235]TCP31397.1 pimeloyl-ACP methyl ester carboxylesterase [Sphingomonas sp. BK235]
MISPYTIHISDERLSDIRAKVDAYDWSQLPDAGGWSAGVGIEDLKRLAAYWRDSYDWRAVERRLNELPNFTADVEGERLHFVHVKGDGSKPPILLLHGWPGSYVEFEQLLEPLAADGHDVIVPSLPGFAFSTPLTRPIGPRRAAAIVHGLMRQLFGSARYVIQGGDWGHAIAAWAAHDRPEAVLGIHINMMTVRAEDAVPTSDEEKSFAAKRATIAAQESAYFHEQETRPQTLGVAMADSPVGAAGWIFEKFGKWADLPTTADGDPDIWSKFSEEELLTNIMLYVATESFVTATWIYYGCRLEKSLTLPPGARIQVPTGVAAFPDPVFLPSPRSFVEKTYNVVHWTEMPRGGHFAALKEPELMLADLRTFIATVMEARSRG